MHNAAGFTAEHRRQAERWDLAAIARDLRGSVALYVGGSDEDPYEHRQIRATRQRVPQAEVLAFPGGHLTTSEHPDLLAAAIRDIAERHSSSKPRSFHHTQCGTGFLGDPGFRHQAAQVTGLPGAALEASAVADPHSTVKAEVERLLTSPLPHLPK